MMLLLYPEAKGCMIQEKYFEGRSGLYLLHTGVHGNLCEDALALDLVHLDKLNASTARIREDWIRYT